MLQSRDNPHAINSVLQLCVTLSFTVSVAQLCDQNIEENYYNHRHVGQENQDRQPANKKQKKRKTFSKLQKIHGGMFKLDMTKQIERKTAKRKNIFTLYFHQQISCISQ